MNQNKQKLIEKGMKWMRNSNDEYHDYIHAENVEKYALEICKSEGFNDPDFLLNLRIACWWHDCYRSTHNLFSFKSLKPEGIGSYNIFKIEAKDFLDSSEIELIGEAIALHNNSPIFFLIRRDKFTGLNRILIEADNLDALNMNRFKTGGVIKLFAPIYMWYVRFSYSLLPMYKYTKERINNFSSLNK